MKRAAAEKKRCPWVSSDNELMVRYHDEEWGRPVHDDRVLFEFLILEGAQAGLSWDTILKKRESYRRLFAKFDPRKVAKFGEAEVEKCLADAGIVRHEGKIRSAISNAHAFLAVVKEFGSFSEYLWRFVDGTPIKNSPRSAKDYPTRTSLSDALAKDLKKRGFKFVGTSICYAYMQAVGLVNDHSVDCYLHNKM